MKIRSVDAFGVALPLVKPMVMSGVTIAFAENLIVRIEGDDGRVGWGEAASAPAMTGETLPGMIHAARTYLTPLAIGRPISDAAAIVAGFARVLYGNGGTKSALEMALFDLLGKFEHRALSALLGGRRHDRVAPMWMLGNSTIDADCAEAQKQFAAGFRFFKVKVGSGDVAGDVAKTLAIRAALGRDVRLCADANGGLGAGAQRYVIESASAQLDFLEQPYAAEDLAAMAQLAQTTGVAICADEGIHTIADIDAHADRGAAAGVSLKAIKLGGVRACVRAADRAQQRGMRVNVAAKVAESGIATSAALSLAAALPATDWGVSLTSLYLAADLVHAPLRIAEGTLAVPTAPGLGVDVDERAVAQYRITTER